MDGQTHKNMALTQLSAITGEPVENLPDRRPVTWEKEVFSPNGFGYGLPIYGPGVDTVHELTREAKQ